MEKLLYTRTATIGGIRYTFQSTPPLWLSGSTARWLWCETEIEMNILNARAYVARAGGYKETAERYEQQASECAKRLAQLSKS